MADVLKKTLGGLRALADDHRSGAAEIADRAAALLEEFCRQAPAADANPSAALGELAQALLTVQPSMAPLLNLANLVQLAAEQDDPSLRSLRVEVEKFRRQRRQATTKIAQLFSNRLRRSSTVLTYTYSSTVLGALSAAARSASGGRRVERVILSESRPLLEGRALATRLAEQGIKVTLVVDAALREHVAAADAVVVGADTVFERAYVNKMGTRVLQEQARTAGKPFFVLADTAKFLPPALAAFHRVEAKPTKEVWDKVPQRVTVLNQYFETIPFQRHVTLLSERGLMPQARVRAWVDQLEVARRWRDAAPGGQS